jgi:hydrogenase nickel incorporation protein HypA/HybF
MHEVAIVQDMFRIIGDISKEQQLKRIDKVNFIIGKMMQVVPDLFRFAFDAAKEGTIAANAELEIEFWPVKMECSQCHAVFQMDDHIFRCPQCQSVDLDVIQGRELFIKSIEGE